MEPSDDKSISVLQKYCFCAQIPIYATWAKLLFFRLYFFPAAEKSKQPRVAEALPRSHKALFNERKFKTKPLGAFGTLPAAQHSYSCL
jgi:hypothetical protein